MKRFIITILSISFILCLMVSVFYCVPAHASIMLRIMGVNPDEKRTQTVQIKTYLPSEVGPGDVLEKGDLEVIYDTQRGAYYVYGEYKLGPKESIRRDVEIRDIWQIPQEELEGLREDTIKTLEFLEGTQFSQRANFLKEGIEKKLNDIIKRQNMASASPQKHISGYRENVRFLDSAKTDLILVRSLLGQAKPLPSLSIWKVFLGIICFLGLIGASLFFFLYKRARIVGKVPADSEISVIETEVKAPQETGGEEKKISPGDIEKMMEDE